MPAKKPAASRKTYHYSVWVDPEQREEIDKAAEEAGEDNPSTWLRKLGLKAARGELVEAGDKKRSGR